MPAVFNGLIPIPRTPACIAGGGIFQQEDPESMSATKGRRFVMQLNRVLLPRLPETLCGTTPAAAQKASCPEKQPLVQAANEGLPTGLALPFGQLLYPLQGHCQLRQGQTYSCAVATAVAASVL